MTNSVEERLKKLEEQNKQMLFMLNLLVVDSKFSVLRILGEKDLYVCSSAMGNGIMNKDMLLDSLKSSIAEQGIPQGVLEKLAKER